MDPLGSVKPWKDTTYFLMRACVERGHTVGYADPGWLSLRHDEPYSRIQWLDVRDDHDVPFTVLADETVPLSRADAVWLRTDPPFDRGYLQTPHGIRAALHPRWTASFVSRHCNV